MVNDPYLTMSSYRKQHISLPQSRTQPGCYKRLQCVDHAVIESRMTHTLNSNPWVYKILRGDINWGHLFNIYILTGDIYSEEEY